MQTFSTKSKNILMNGSQIDYEKFNRSGTEISLELKESNLDKKFIEIISARKSIEISIEDMTFDVIFNRVNYGKCTDNDKRTTEEQENVKSEHTSESIQDTRTIILGGEILYEKKKE